MSATTSPARTRRAASYRQTAALRIAEADGAAEPAEQERLRAEAAEAHALADTLDARAAELQQVDDARAHWLAHTAGTRAAAERAKAELTARHVDDTEPEQQVTAEEWLAAHRAALAQDEPHRDITWKQPGSSSSPRPASWSGTSSLSSSTTGPSSPS